MESGEYINTYLQRVNDVVIKIKAFGESMPTSTVIKKVLRTLTSAFDSKVSAIEEAKDLNTLTWDELLGSLTSYEMRTIKVKSDNK